MLRETSNCSRSLSRNRRNQARNRSRECALPDKLQDAMPAGLEKQLVNAVNPRLALYTRAGLLAVLILILNYALVAALAGIGMTVCTSSTSTEHTEPTTSGDANVHH